MTLRSEPGKEPASPQNLGERDAGWAAIRCADVRFYINEPTVAGTPTLRDQAFAWGNAQKASPAGTGKP